MTVTQSSPTLADVTGAIGGRAHAHRPVGRSRRHRGPPRSRVHAPTRPRLGGRGPRTPQRGLRRCAAAARLLVAAAASVRAPSRRSCSPLLGWRYAAGLADRLPWRRLLLASYAASLAWLLSLALVDGTDGLSRVLGNPYEYLETAREVGERVHPAGHLHRPDPLRGRRQLADPRRRSPAGDAALLRRAGAARARRRPRRGCRRHPDRRLDRRGRAGDAARPRRRGAGPPRRAVPRPDAGRGLHGRLGRRRDHRGHGVGPGGPGARGDQRRTDGGSGGPRWPGCSWG